MCTAARVPSVDALSWPPRYRTITGLNIKMFLMHLRRPVYLWPISCEISSNFPENSKPNMLYSLMKYWTIPRTYSRVRAASACIHGLDNNIFNRPRWVVMPYMCTHFGIFTLFFTRPTDIFAAARDEQELT